MLNLLNPIHHLIAFALCFAALYLPVGFVCVVTTMSFEVLNITTWPEFGRFVFCIFVVGVYAASLLSGLFKRYTNR